VRKIAEGKAGRACTIAAEAAGMVATVGGSAGGAAEMEGPSRR